QTEQADLLLLCLEAGTTIDENDMLLLQRPWPPVVGVATKCDLSAPPPGLLATSAVAGIGLEAVRELLANQACSRKQPAMAPSLSRCRRHVEACLAHLRQAHETVLYEDPPELLAVELRGAL